MVIFPALQTECVVFKSLLLLLPIFIRCLLHNPSIKNICPTAQERENLRNRNGILVWQFVRVFHENKKIRWSSDPFQRKMNVFSLSSAPKPTPPKKKNPLVLFVSYFLVLKMKSSISEQETLFVHRIYASNSPSKLYSYALGWPGKHRENGKGK